MFCFVLICLFWFGFEREIHSVLNNSLGVVRGHDFMDVFGPTGEEKDLGEVIKPTPPVLDREASSRFS